MKKLIRKLILWAFKDYITGIGLDHHLNSNSWAVFSLGSEHVEYVAFIELRDKDVYDIRSWLQKFQDVHVNIDKNPFINKDLFFKKPFWE